MQLLFIWKTSLHLAIRVMSCENIKCPYLSPVQSWFPCWELFSHLECQSSGCMCEAMYYCIKYSSHLCYTKLVLAVEHKFTCWKSKSTYLRFELGQCAMDRFLSLKNSSSLSRRFTPWNAVICKQQNDVNIFQIFMQHTVSYVSLKVCRNGMNMYYISKKLTTDMGNLLYGWTFFVRKKFWQFPMQFSSCKNLF